MNLFSELSVAHKWTDKSPWIKVPKVWMRPHIGWPLPLLLPFAIVDLFSTVSVLSLRNAHKSSSPTVSLIHNPLFLFLCVGARIFSFNHVVFSCQFEHNYSAVKSEKPQSQPSQRSELSYHSQKIVQKGLHVQRNQPSLSISLMWIVQCCSSTIGNQHHNNWVPRSMSITNGANLIVCFCFFFSLSWLDSVMACSVENPF